MSDPRTRARALVEAIAAEERARFRDVEADGVCWREMGIDAEMEHGPGWRLFWMLGVGTCSACEPCIEAAWDAYLREEAERDD